MSNTQLMIKAQRGFTLIELLVVMVLIAALFSAVTISTGTNNSKRNLVEEGQRLDALFTEASQHAILYNQEIGWYITEDGYGFLTFNYDENIWQELTLPMFRERSIPFEIELEELDGLPIAEQLDNVYKTKKTSDSDKLIPSLVFLSSGELSSFELTLYESIDEEWKVTLVSDGFGSATLNLPYDEEEE